MFRFYRLPRYQEWRGKLCLLHTNYYRYEINGVCVTRGFRHLTDLLQWGKLVKW